MSRFLKSMQEAQAAKATEGTEITKVPEITEGTEGTEVPEGTEGTEVPEGTKYKVLVTLCTSKGIFKVGSIVDSSSVSQDMLNIWHKGSFIEPTN